MSGKGIIIALSSVLIAAAPAGAKTEPTQNTLKSGQQAPAAADKKFCIKDTVTGTRMKAQECRTKAEWTRAGIDIDEVLKSK